MNLIATDHQMMTLGNRLIYLDYKYQLNLGCYIECQSFFTMCKGALAGSEDRYPSNSIFRPPHIHYIQLLIDVAKHQAGQEMPEGQGWNADTWENRKIVEPVLLTVEPAPHSHTNQCEKHDGAVIRKQDMASISRITGRPDR